MLSDKELLYPDRPEWKTIDQHGLKHFRRFDMGHGDLLMWDGSTAVYLSSCTGGNGEDDDTYEKNFECSCLYDGPRHLWFAPESECQKGYVYYPAMRKLSKALAMVDELTALAQPFYREELLENFSKQCKGKIVVATVGDLDTEVTFLGKSFWDEIGFKKLASNAPHQPAGTARLWCQQNGIPIVECPELPSHFFIDPQNEDQAFHVKMRWQ